MAGVGLVVILMILAVHVEAQESVTLGGNTGADFVAPTVFQAAGPTIASIEATITAYRNALGTPNGNVTQEVLTGGRREINWDGNPLTDATTPPVNPFNTFLNNRGAQFTTPGIGLSQAPPSGGQGGGLAQLFANAGYATEFKAFSNARLFTPVGSNITDTFFFTAGSNGNERAVVTGFGVVFTDVDQPDGSGPGAKRGNRGSSTLVQYFGADGRLLYSSFAPASPGNGGFSFLGIKFNDARIASVRIIAGDVAPGPNDEPANDVVMMDDFIYGEPRKLSSN
jgi:hypothetical protein